MDEREARSSAGHRPTGYGASPVCLRAIGPTHGMSQRTPVKALIIAMIMMTRSPRWTRADTKAHIAPKIGSGHWDRPKDCADDPRHDVKENPDAAENDRLHGIKADELIVLFEDVKNQTADERDAGERGGDVGGQACRAGSRSGSRGGGRRRRIGRRRRRVG